MTNFNEERLFRQHVLLLGWLFVGAHALLSMTGIFLFLLFAGIGFASNDDTASSILLIIGVLTAIFLQALSLPGIIAGFGLLTAKPWSRGFSVVVALFSLLNVPIGTCIGAYGLWVLLQPSADSYFGSVRISAEPEHLPVGGAP